MPEMDKYPAEILIVFFDPIIQLFDLRLVQKTQHVLLQLAASPARNNFDQGDPFGHRLIDNTRKLRVDRPAFVENTMEIQFNLCH